MSFQIKRADSVEMVQLLDAQLFPGDGRVNPHDLAWCAYDAQGFAVAYATGKIWTLDNWFLFTRCGVADEARGHGLQRRLIRARLAHAKRSGCHGAYTYTLPHLLHSANNLIAEGFKLWRPAYRWGGAAALYWQRSF